MTSLVYAWLWCANKLRRSERGQTSIEYVLVVLAVVLFLIVAAAAMTGVLNGAVTKISTWINSVTPPAVP